VSVKKLKAGEDGLSAQQIVGYLLDRQDAGDYYSEDGEAFMRWFTTDRVKSRFALRGSFDRVALRYLLEGRDPVTGESIRNVGANNTKVAAIDLTVSPSPKSVSILWALADDPLRFEIELTVGNAVNAAVGRMLAEHPLIRRRFGGEAVPVVADDYVVAQAFHTTARLSGNGHGVPDPQLHVHNLLVGALGENGRLLAIESRYVMDFQAELEAEATGYLAAMLRERGFELEVDTLERRGNGQPSRRWELKGVPPSLIKAMSSRTAEIDDLKRQYMDATGREPIGNGWEAFVMSHRGPKARLTAPELRAEWEVEAAEHGLTPATVAAMREDANQRRRTFQPPAEDGPEAREFRRLMLEWICRDHAFVTFADMERLAHQLAVGLLSPRQADFVVAEMLGDGDLLITTDRKVTTLEILGYEKRVRAAVAELLAAAPSPAVAVELIDEELARREADGAPFDEGQAEAIRLALSGARFVSITGKAGTGKGYASTLMTDLWRASGRRVIALAVAGLRAQQAGADAGADDAMTVDRLRVAMAQSADQLHGAVRAGTLRLDERDVLLVDEAGMLDHHRYASLVEAAVAAGATLVQIGDDKQLSPIGPGGLWTVTHELAAVAGRAVELRDIHRAREERERQAWDELRDGKVAEALTWMAQHDRVRVYDTRPELQAGIVAAWWAGDRDRLMVTDTSNAERDVLNELAQARRREAGELGDEPILLSSGRSVHVGDRVLFNAIYRPDDRRKRRVENGTPAVVVSVRGDLGEIELELNEPRRRPRRLVLGADAPLDLGYARHVVKAQGVTAEDTDLAVSRHTARNELYVMATRARNGARVHAITAELADGLEIAPEQLRLAPVTPSPGVEEEEAARGQTTERDGSAATSVITVAALNEAIAAERERREREETVRQISRRAGRSSTKEAVGAREMTDRPAERAAHREHGDVRVERMGRERRDYEPAAEHHWERSFTISRRAAPRMARAAVAPSASRSTAAPQRRSEALPAHDPAESVARHHLETVDTVRAMALFRIAARLHEADDPAARLAQLLVSDPEGVAIVQDDDQERRLRQALALTPEQRHGVAEDGDRWAGRIIRADAAYDSRFANRQEWLEAMDPDQRQFAFMPEPGAISRAYVLADEPWASPALTRAVSAAADSHLVVPHLRPGLAVQVQQQEAEIGAAREHHARQRSSEQAERAREHAYGRYSRPEPEAARSREAAHEVER
jgi:conjugative relaxase-like TrwC/TraI family protein